jgi:hypothetical protein
VVFGERRGIEREPLRTDHSKTSGDGVCLGTIRIPPTHDQTGDTGLIDRVSRSHQPSQLDGHCVIA